MPTYNDVFSGRSQYTLRFIVTQGTQDVVNNRTLMSWSLTIVETSEWGSWSASAATWAANVNGAVGSGSKTYDFRGSSDSLLLGSGSTWVTHTASGAKSISVSASVGGNTTIGNAAIGSTTLALTTIPRASVASWAVQGGLKYMGTPYVLNMNRASSGFTHDVTYKFGTKTGTIGTGIGASVSWTMPTDLMTEIPNALTGSGVITTKTYSGATLIGTTTSNFAATVPLDATPDFTTITHAEATPGLAALIGAYVQGVTTLSLAITGAVGISGSTITGYQIKVAGQTINAASGTSTPINMSGTIPIEATVTDSRGRTKTKSVNITLLAYSPPKFVTPPTVQRSLSGGTANEEGTYLRVNINGSVQSLINGTQKNALRYRVSTRIKGAPTFTVKVDTTTVGITFNSYVNVGTYSITDAYDVLVEVIDKFATSQFLITVPVAKIFMHWDENIGVGIGKYREQGALDVAGLIYQNAKKVTSLQETLYLTSSTTFSKATYPWLQYIKVKVQAAGGAGGGSQAAAGGNHSAGGGGGGGAYVEKIIQVASLGASENVGVGVGGLGVSGASGNDGNPSYFGAHAIAGGGIAGATSTQSALAISAAGGSGGTPSLGDILVNGGAGAMSGGAATLGEGAPGGAAMLGGGARGVYTGAGGGSQAGFAAGNYGGGGGGASTNAGGAAAAGGAGGNGIVIIELYG